MTIPVVVVVFFVLFMILLLFQLFSKWFFVAETHEFRLLRDLFEHYDKEVRPVFNTSSPVHVKFSLSLIQIISVVSEPVYNSL